MDEFEKVVLSGMLAGSLGPLIVLAIAAAALGNEIEDRTLANITLSPIPRWKIALPKLLAVITIAGPIRPRVRPGNVKALWASRRALSRYADRRMPLRELDSIRRLQPLSY